MDKPCEQCGVMLYGVHPSRRFCQKCSDQRNLARMAERRRERGCRICGASLENEPPQAELCETCRRASRLKSAANATAAKRNRKRKRRETIGSINEKARSAGLSYGKYMAGRARQ